MKQRKLLAILLTIITVFSLCLAGCGNNGGNGKVEDDFGTVLRFVVCSDTHISSIADETAQRFTKLFKSSYAYAESQAYDKLDAIVVVGDMTNYGQPYELQAWNTIVDQNVKKGTEVITVMGNHEYYAYLKDLPAGVESYTNNRDSELNKHVVINGFHFIGISTYGEGDYADDLKWLEKNLKEAAEADPDKPIITFQHHHIKNTVYTSPEWNARQSVQLDKLYSQYSQVINFSGHSHAPINDPTSCYQKDYTLFGTGTLAYFEMASGMSTGTKPVNGDQAAQFYIVEVNKDNQVRVLPYNLLTDDFFKTADGSQQLIYQIDDLKDKTTWKYTDARKDASEAPYFEEGAEIVIDKVAQLSATIKIPQAKDDDCVYSYNVVCESAEGKKKEYNFFSEYFFEPMPEYVTVSLSALTADTDYTISVYPVDVFGKKGECIQATFSTAASGKYTSKNPVNFVGTFTNFESLTSPITATDTFAYGGKVTGDIFVGAWNENTTYETSKYEVAAGVGYEGSTGLTLWSETSDNQGVYIFGTGDNKNTVSFPSVNYLRVWVDFSDVDFRKASFGFCLSVANYIQICLCPSHHKLLLTQGFNGI